MRQARHISRGLLVLQSKHKQSRPGHSKHKSRQGRHFSAPPQERGAPETNAGARKHDQRKHSALTPQYQCAFSRDVEHPNYSTFATRQHVKFCRPCEGRLPPLTRERLNHRGVQFLISRPQRTASVRETLRSLQLHSLATGIHGHRPVVASLWHFMH